MKDFMKRKVKIFGFSVPVSLILLVVVSGIALAVFLNIYSSTVNVTAMAGPTGDMLLTDCDVSAGPGTAGGVLTGNDLAVTATGIDNTSVVRCRLNYTATNGDQVYTFVPPAVPPAGLSNTTSSLPNGTIFLHNVDQNIQILMYFADVTPLQVVDEFSFSLEFADN